LQNLRKIALLVAQAIFRIRRALAQVAKSTALWP
jgi:hypothetical protein